MYRLRQENLSLKDRFGSQDQVCLNPRLNHISEGARLQGGLHDLWISLDGANHNPSALREGIQFPGDLDAVQLWHLNIQHDQIWLMLTNKIQCQFAISRRGYDVELGC